MVEALIAGCSLLLGALVTTSLWLYDTKRRYLSTIADNKYLLHETLIILKAGNAAEAVQAQHTEKLAEMERATIKEFQEKMAAKAEAKEKDALGDTIVTPDGRRLEIVGL